MASVNKRQGHTVSTLWIRRNGKVSFVFEMITHSVPVHCPVSYHTSVLSWRMRVSFLLAYVRHSYLRNWRNIRRKGVCWSGPVWRVSPKNVNNVVGRLIRQSGNMGIMFAWFHRSCSNTCCRQLVDRRILLWHIIAIGFRFVCCFVIFVLFAYLINIYIKCMHRYIITCANAFSHVAMNEKYLLMRFMENLRTSKEKRARTVTYA